MVLLNQKLLSKIENKILELGSLYKKYRAIILTEDDLKCLIFMKLFEINEISGFEHVTYDSHVLGSKIHAELSWFNENGKLTIKPDLTIVEPKYLSIIRSIEGGRLPSKQYSFGGEVIIVEIKFCRYKRGITKKFFENVKKDFEKINNKLFSKLSNEGLLNSIFCFYVLFAKNDKCCNEFKDFLIIIKKYSLI